MTELRKRSEAKKSTAAERTEAIPDKSPGPGSECPECGDMIVAGSARRRADGRWECPHCAMVVEFSPGGVARAAASTGLTPKDHNAASSPRGDEALVSLYCKVCATRISIAKVGPKGDRKTRMFWPCGHDDQGYVDDPARADKIKPVAGSQMLPAPPSRVPGAAVAVVQEPRLRGPVVSVERPNNMFRVADFSSFNTDKFFVSFEVPPGQTIEQAIDEIREILDRKADEDFDRKSDWYLEKLGLLRKKTKGGG